MAATWAAAMAAATDVGAAVVTAAAANTTAVGQAEAARVAAETVGEAKEARKAGAAMSTAVTAAALDAVAVNEEAGMVESKVETTAVKAMVVATREMARVV